MSLCSTCKESDDRDKIPSPLQGAWAEADSEGVLKLVDDDGCHRHLLVPYLRCTVPFDPLQDLDISPWEKQQSTALAFAKASTSLSRGKTRALSCAIATTAKASAARLTLTTTG